MVCSEMTTSYSSGCSSSSVDRRRATVKEEEMEAAEALADLAHLAMRENSGCGNSAGIWGMKGKRAKKRVKSDSPPSESNLHLVLQDEVVMSVAECERVAVNVTAEVVKSEPVMDKKIEKSEQDGELTNSTPICTTSYPSFNSTKSRRNLTEEEKEERRIRRILANRESARQTIRRRQALCDDLTKKAADLTSENESLKRKKELAVKQYQSLEETNRLLKVQISQARKAEIEETLDENTSAYVQIPSTSPMNSHFLVFNRPPITPVFWPSIIQSSNSIQLQQVPQNPVAIPSNISNTADSSDELGKPINMNGSRTPLYVIPSPWLFPHFENGSGLQPRSPCQENKQEGAFVNNQGGVRSSLRTELVDTSGMLEDGGRTDLNGNPAQSPPDRGNQHVSGFRPVQKGPRELFLSPLLNHGGAVSTIKENGLEPDFSASTEKSTTACHPFAAMPENSSEQTIYHSKKIADAIAAAEARKRRKKLTKLKNLHGRQCRMQC